MEELNALIRETERWLRLHKQTGRGIEALACQIRLKALKEAKECFDGTNR